MKKSILLHSTSFALSSSLFFLACSEKERNHRSGLDEQNSGYVIGVDIAARLKRQPFPIDLQSVLDGLSDYYQGKQLRMPLDSIYKLQEGLAKMGQAIEMEMSKNREKAMTFLNANGRKADIHQASGIQYSILQPGAASGSPSDSDWVVCNISCSLLDGTSVKNTWKSRKPERFLVAKAVPGLAAALKTMTPGRRLRVWVPPELGYGREGVRGSVPAYSLLVYEIELLAIEGT